MKLLVYGLKGYIEQLTGNSPHLKPGKGVNFLLTVIAPVLQALRLKAETTFAHDAATLEKGLGGCDAVLALGWSLTSYDYALLEAAGLRKPTAVLSDSCLIGSRLKNARSGLGFIPPGDAQGGKAKHVGLLNTLHYQSGPFLRNYIENTVLLDHPHYVPDRPDKSAEIREWLTGTNYEADQLFVSKTLSETGLFHTPHLGHVKGFGLLHSEMMSRLARYEAFIVTHPESLGQQAVEATLLGLNVLAYRGFLSGNLVRHLAIREFDSKEGMLKLLADKPDRKAASEKALALTVSPGTAADSIIGALA